MCENLYYKKTFDWFGCETSCFCSLENIYGGIVLCVSPCLTSVSICDYWRGIKKISFNIPSTKPHFKGISMSVRFQRRLHVKDPLCTQHCAPRPCSSDVSHSGTLLYFDVTESYGSNQACSVYAWSQHQQELHVTTVMSYMWLLCGSLAMTEISLRYTEFTVGSTVQQEQKQWWYQGEAERGVLHILTGLLWRSVMCNGCSSHKCCRLTSISVGKNTENDFKSNASNALRDFIHDKNEAKKWKSKSSCLGIRPLRRI